MLNKTISVESQKIIEEYQIVDDERSDKIRVGLTVFVVLFICILFRSDFHKNKQDHEFTNYISKIKNGNSKQLNQTTPEPTTTRTTPYPNFTPTMIWPDENKDIDLPNPTYEKGENFGHTIPESQNPCN